MKLGRLISGALLALTTGCDRTPSGPTPAAASGLGLADALGGGGDTAGFARALAPPDLRFPADHGPHRDYRTEWWYVTANLDGDDGHRFGVELVFFRQALAPPVPDTPVRVSELATREVILAHAAVTDIDGRRFHCAQRVAREAAGLAGVEGGAAQPFRIRCVDWSAAAAAGGDGLLPLDIAAGDRAFRFTLRVASGKPPVPNGDRGLSRKNAIPGNASIYYSMTRLPIAGELTVAGRTHRVRGLAWLDREWMTAALAPDQSGWDWFALQLDDGSDLMWYSLRRRDGGSDVWSRGTLVDADGVATPLAASALRAEPRGRWRAPDGLAEYPAAWRLVGDTPALDLEITPLLPDQELHTLVRYWEGAVAVRGTRSGRPVGGRGYLEMTGYAVGR
ncbi:MAG: carotenoid 1,2-hydratase [Planctomycetes bacterium]|nr:carotenoid 1,2-hydratase [Planctomycetota bacterium]